MAESSYQASLLSAEEVARLPGLTLLDFGVDWCPHCQAAQGPIAAALGDTGINRIQVEDGKGRPLGRSFGVKLWPTLVFLKDGQEVGRVVRPVDPGPVAEVVSRLISS